MKPTYEQLEARNRQLEDLLKKALDRITVLEERLNQDSNNSSKPPSTDWKKNSKKAGKKQRPPREGMARSLVPLEQVDAHTVCQLDACPHCGSGKICSGGDPLVIQQVELPDTKGFLTQYDLCNYRCHDCDTKAIAPLPLGVPKSAFGPRLMALVANLTGVFHLSKDDAKRLISDLYSIDISDGSVINIEERVASALDPVYRRIHRFVTESSFFKHFDETPWRDSGITHYVWVASTKLATCYRIDRRRNTEAFLTIAGRLNKLAPVVTDRYGVYGCLENPRQFCIPHLIRNFRHFAQRDGPDGAIGSKIEKELQYLSHTHKLFRAGKIPQATCSQRIRRCRERVDGLFMDALAEASQDLGALCEKLLLDDFDNLWTFQRYADAEPSNNLAERDLRRIVLWRKKSYGTRSDRGKLFAQTITSVAETLRRSGKNIFDFLVESVRSLYAGNDAPLIRPQNGF